MSKILKSILAVALLGGALPAAAAGPDEKIAVTAEEVAALYTGKTLFWETGRSTSGGYWAPDGKFEAVWKEAVGIGKWYATGKGDLCYDVKWRRKPREQVTEVKLCWRHVKDSEGTWWKRDPETKKWYNAEEELSERVEDGNQIGETVAKMRKKLGM